MQGLVVEASLAGDDQVGGPDIVGEAGVFGDNRRPPTRGGRPGRSGPGVLAIASSIACSIALRG